MAIRTGLTNLRLWPLDRSRLPPEGLLRWWWWSLTGCLPSRLRRLLAGSSDRLLVEPGEGVAAISLVDEAGRRELAELDLQAPVKPVLEGVDNPRRLPLELRLPAGMLLKKTLGLPASVGDDLRQVLGFEMDRLTPFSADQVFYDCRIRSRDAQHEKLQVELVLARRDRVEPWLQALRAVQLPPRLVTAADAWPGANLLPPEQRGARNRASARVNRALALLLLGLMIAVLVGPLLQKRTLLDSLNRDLARVRREANQVVALRDQIQQTLEAARLVLDRRQRTRPVVELLREVTRLLPDDTWLQQFELKGDKLQLRGESAQALGLIERLETSPLFQGVVFLSPVVQVASKGRERFHLSALVSEPTTEGGE